MPKVFLSYARGDLPQINQLEAQLKDHDDIVIDLKRRFQQRWAALNKVPISWHGKNTPTRVARQLVRTESS
jgi:hypothetical protein